MRIAELLNSIASWLESPHNEALLLSEYNEDCMKVVAENCILAAAIIKKTAEEVDEIEPKDPYWSDPEFSFEVYKKVYGGGEDNELLSNDLVSSFTAKYNDALLKVKDIAKELLGPNARHNGGSFGKHGGFWRFVDYSNPNVHLSITATPISNITEEAVQDLANLATALDSSGDPALMKQASVLDELLLTIAAPPNALKEKKAAEAKKIDELTKKYHDIQKSLNETNKVADAVKAIDKSNMTKDLESKPTVKLLSSRYCPEHHGTSVARVGEDLWQCPLDKKTFSFSNGFELSDGTKVPGGSVENQTKGLNENFESIFDTRSGRLGQNQP